MWYSAKVLYECFSVSNADTPMMQEESIRLYHASSMVEAEEKAHHMCSNESRSYLNETGDKIQWQFVEVVEVQDLCIDDLRDGIEVFSELKARS